MAIIEYFKAEESPYHPNKFIIKPTSHLYNLIDRLEGSYHVYEARLFGLPYSQYLRMLRDKYGVDIIGKGQTYPVAYFLDLDKAREVVIELNKRFRIIALHY